MTHPPELVAEVARIIGGYLPHEVVGKSHIEKAIAALDAAAEWGRGQGATTIGEFLSKHKPQPPDSPLNRALSAATEAFGEDKAAGSATHVRIDDCPRVQLFLSEKPHPDTHAFYTGLRRELAGLLGDTP